MVETRKRRKDRIKNKINCGAGIVNYIARSKNCKKTSSKDYLDRVMLAVLHRHKDTITDRAVTLAARAIRARQRKKAKSEKQKRYRVNAESSAIEAIS